MSGWDPPQAGERRDIPVVPNEARASWWKRRYGKVPLWGLGTGGLVAMLAIGALAPDDEESAVSTSDSTIADAQVVPVADLEAASTTDAPQTSVATVPTTIVATTMAPATTVATQTELVVVTLAPPTTIPPATTTAPPTTTTVPAPVATEVQISINFNADGDDNQNKNGEWVRFTNAGSAPLDMSGWAVQDEGAKHTLRFGSIVLDPGGSITLFSGCGDDSASEQYWCNPGSAVWNNDGDVVSLFDATGALVAQRAG